MGAFLDTPITDKATDKTKKGSIAMEPVLYAASCMQGWRIHNEDTHVARLKGAFPGHDEIGFFCVFDGHGGDFAARYCAENVCAAIANVDGP